MNLLNQKEAFKKAIDGYKIATTEMMKYGTYIIFNQNTVGFEHFYDNGNYIGDILVWEENIEPGKEWFYFIDTPQFKIGDIVYTKDGAIGIIDDFKLIGDYYIFDVLLRKKSKYMSDIKETHYAEELELVK